MAFNSAMASRARVRAPELVGKGGWLNTGGKDLTLRDLRGSVVVLDFWTFCCINCLHVLDELRELEERHRDTVVIVGVHSPKFVHEAEHGAVVDAVERYGVHHPVLDDPELATWKQYAVRAWPTLVVIDPEGYVVAQHAGEGHAHAIEKLVGELEAEHAAKGTLRRGDGPYVPPEPQPTDLRFPGKALLLPGGNLLVSDSTRHALVELAADGESGWCGGSAAASAASPTVRPPPRGSASRRGWPCCRTGRPSWSPTPSTTSCARSTWPPARSARSPGPGGSGCRARPPPARHARSRCRHRGTWRGSRTGCGSPWPASTSCGPTTRRTATVEVTAGTTNEGLVDGPAPQAWFAQPSGLAAAGDRLWIADSETSALRYATRSGDGYEIVTAVGTGLFDFGHRDGAADQALLQHPLGVTALPDGSVAVCDTYNHALRRFDPAVGEVSTLATDLREPSDAVVVDGDIVVVESARHRLTRLRLPEEAVRVESAAHRTRRPATDVAAGLRLDVVFSAPAGQKLDTRYGPSTRLLVGSTPPELLLGGDGKGTDLFRDLVLDPAVGEGVLHVSAMAASCDDDPANEYPACHVHQQDWGVPVRVTGTGADRLPLVLAGLDVPAATEAEG